MIVNYYTAVVCGRCRVIVNYYTGIVCGRCRGDCELLHWYSLWEV